MIRSTHAVAELLRTLGYSLVAQEVRAENLRRHARLVLGAIRSRAESEPRFAALYEKTLAEFVALHLVDAKGL